MYGSRPTYVLVAGLLLSLFLHATLLIPALVEVMSGGAGPNSLLARFHPEDFQRLEEEQQQPPPPEDEVRLGIDEGSPSTITWIGYKEYQEHLARLAEVEQAAFKSMPDGADVPPQEAQQPPAEVQPPDNQAAAAQPTEQQPEQTPDPLEEIRKWLDTQNTRKDGAPRPDAPSMDVPEHKALDQALAKLEEIMEGQRESPEQTQQANPVQPQEQATEDMTPGDVAQKESDATSTIEVPLEHLRLGKPLAAQGLEIRTRKPRFTSLVMLTSAPADPRVEIRFRRDGKPAKARFLESSGDQRIDEAILNSLYRWRAKGKKLLELERDETVPVRIRITLGQRR